MAIILDPRKNAIVSFVAADENGDAITFDTVPQWDYINLPQDNGDLESRDIKPTEDGMTIEITPRLGWTRVTMTAMADAKVYRTAINFVGTEAIEKSSHRMPLQGIFGVREQGVKFTRKLGPVDESIAP